MAGPNPSESGRFVILWHTVDNMPGRQNHFDFLLEFAGFFVTIELMVLPWQVNSARGRVLPPHRLEYWELEGPISGHRGCVKRITRGYYQLTTRGGGNWDLKLDSADVQALLAIRIETSEEFAQLPPDTEMLICAVRT